MRLMWADDNLLTWHAIERCWDASSCCTNVRVQSNNGFGALALVTLCNRVAVGVNMHQIKKMQGHWRRTTVSTLHSHRRHSEEDWQEFAHRVS